MSLKIHFIVTFVEELCGHPIDAVLVMPLFAQRALQTFLSRARFWAVAALELHLFVFLWTHLS